MPKKFIPKAMHNKEGFVEKPLSDLPNAGIQLTHVIKGESTWCSAELALVANQNAQIILGTSVRSLKVYSLGSSCFVSKEDADLAVAADGLKSEQRVFIPANTVIELPWYWDEVHALSAQAATLYVTGLV